MLGFIFLVAVTGAQAQDVTNTGSTFSVGSGGILYVPGAFLNAVGSTLTTDGGLLQVGGTLSNAGTTSLGSGTLQVGGNLVSTGSLSSGTSTVQLSGSAAQSVQLPAGTALYNLTINNSSGATPGVSVPSSLVVNGTLLLTNGLVRTAASAILSLPDGATIRGEATGRYVQGNLKVTRSTVAGPVDFGNGAVLDGTGQSLGIVSITRTAGLGTTGVSYGQNVGGTTKGIDRVWAVAPAQQPTAAVPLTLTWLADDDNGLSSFVQASIWQAARAAGPWSAVSPASTNASSHSLSSSTNSLNSFTVSNAANPLPVELVTFDAQVQGDDALLRWATASERNNDRFDVEASADGRSFQPIAAIAGHGTSAQPWGYQFLDKNLARYGAPLLYYRLRQRDADSQSQLSPVRTVHVGTPASFAAQLYPNPVRGAAASTLLVRTATAGPVSWDVADAMGRRVLGQDRLLLPVGTSILALPTATLPAGQYVLRLQQAAQVHLVKLVRE